MKIEIGELTLNKPSIESRANEFEVKVDENVYAVNSTTIDYA